MEITFADGKRVKNTQRHWMDIGGPGCVQESKETQGDGEWQTSDSKRMSSDPETGDKWNLHGKRLVLHIKGQKSKVGTSETWKLMAL